MRVDITNNRRVEVAGNRTNCHDFTGAVLRQAHYDHRNFISPIIAPYIVGGFAILLGTFISSEIARIYSIMINNRHALPFNLLNYMNNEVPAGSLIIFATPPINGNRIIQHSMIKVENDIWQGANNINSLGPLNSVPIISETLNDNPTGVFSYPLMSLRTYIPTTAPTPAGGWTPDSRMKSMTGEPYEMFHIPIF